MSHTENSLMDLEYLQQLSYERSKKWATFFDVTQNMADMDESQELDLNELSTVFESAKNNDAYSDDLSSMEDSKYEENDVDCEILRDLTHHSINPNEKIVAVESSTKLMDLFNQTMPIVSEHNRKLKEYGFDKVLNTFDVKKIEDKVGDWLKRHNSLCGGTTYGQRPSRYYVKTDNQRNVYDAKYLSPKLLYDNHRNSKKEKSSNRGLKSYRYHTESHSDDSMHSGDTARYIRSSRNALRKNTSKTMTIKTYRMDKNKRQALREKYTIDRDAEDEDSRHLKTICRRRRTAEFIKQQSGCNHNCYEYNVLQTNSKSCSSSRRKMLKKRTISYNESTSSDSDYSHKDVYSSTKLIRYCSKTSCKQNRQHLYHTDHISCTLPAVLHAPPSSSVIRKFTPAPNLRNGYGSRKHYYMNSSSSSSQNSFSHCNRINRRKADVKSIFFGDARPCKRESECRCCNDEKLCSNYIHVANCSTEENWFVENCSDIKQKENETMYKRELNESKTKEVSPEKPKQINKDNKKSKKSRKPNSKMQQKVNSEPDNDENFELQLQLALKESKQLYEQQQRDKKKHKALKHDNDDNEYLMPVKVSSDNKEKCENWSSVEENTIDKNNTHKLLKDINMDNENTFLAPANTICNSTAKTLDSAAYKRRFADSMITNVSTMVDLKKSKKLNLKKNIHEETLTAKSTKKKSKSTTEAEKSSLLSASKFLVQCNSTALTHDTPQHRQQFADSLTCNTDTSSSLFENNTMQEFRGSRKTKTHTKPPSNSTCNSRNIQEHSDGVVPVKKKQNSNVTSTTLVEPSPPSLAETSKARIYHIIDSSEGEDNECTIVSSTTTDVEPRQSIQQKGNSSQKPNNFIDADKGILIYTPPNDSPESASGYFNITKAHLSSVIGEKAAEKFLKFYLGRKRFNVNSRVYFKPPSQTEVLERNDASSDSEDDIFDCVGHVGDLYESFTNF